MKISGHTIGKKYVLQDIFKLVGTHGVPLEIVLQFLKDRNYVVDWVDYIIAALKDGHNFDTIKGRILAAVGDVYGPNYKKEIEIRLHKLYEQYITG